MLVYNQVWFVWRSSRFNLPITRRSTFAAWRWITSGWGYLGQSRQTKGAGRRTGPPNPRAPRLGPRAFIIGGTNLLGISFVRMPMSSLFTHQFQAEPCHCSRRVAPIIERIYLDCASNPMRVLIGWLHRFKR